MGAVKRNGVGVVDWRMGNHSNTHRWIGRVWLSIILITGGISISLTGSAAAKLINYKLSGSMPAFGDVKTFGEVEPAISEDGRYVVFVADRETDNVMQLYSVAIERDRAPVRLSPAMMPADRHIEWFQVSPDSRWVVFRADHHINDQFELYSVPIGGGPVTRLLEGVMASGGDIGLTRISPDSRWVIYIADQIVDERDWLWHVPIGGGQNDNISRSIAVEGDVRFFRISPDSSRVVYTADQQQDEVVNLYSVPIDGSSSPDMISGSMISAGDVDDFMFAISPDSSRVVYMGDQHTDEVVELYAVDLAGGNFMKLNRPLVSGGDVRDFRISPDSSLVVYIADQDTEGMDELYYAGLKWFLFGDPKINGPMVTGGRALNFQISPDGKRVVYTAEQEVANKVEIYGYSFSSASRAKLNPPLAAGGNVNYWIYAISPDNNRVLFLADPEDDDMNELYGHSFDSGVTSRLNSPLEPNSFINKLAVSPDGTRAAYNTMFMDSGRRVFTEELRARTFADGKVSLLNKASAGNMRVYSFMFSPDGRRVVYTADEEREDVFELFCSYDDGKQSNILLLLPAVLSEGLKER